MSQITQIVIFFAVLIIPLNAQKNILPPKAIEDRLPARILIRKEIALQPSPQLGTSTRLKAKEVLKEEHIQLKDGDIFRGKFSGFNLTEGVYWKHPHISPELIINPEHVKHIQLTPRETTKELDYNPTKVTLFSGDELSGELKSMTDGVLKLNTWYGGQIDIKQSSIKSLIPSFTSLKTVYQGPKNINDWTFYDPSSGQIFSKLGENPKTQEIETKKKKINLAHGTWKLNNGSFETKTSQSRVGRQFKELPERMQLDFDLDWSSYLNLYINFLTDKLDSYSKGNSYCLRLNTSYAYLYKYSLQNGIAGGRNMGSNVRVNLTSSGNHARISIRIDRKKNIIALYVNEKFLKKWTDTQREGLPANANGLLFTSMSSNLIELSHIKISEWNGKLPDGNKSTTQNGTEDFVLFANEDSVSGKLVGIENGKIKFKTTFAEIPIPIQTITRINMAHRNPTATPAKGTVRAILHKTQGQVSGSIRSWKNGKISLESDSLGAALFDQNAFERIEFDN